MKLFLFISLSIVLTSCWPSSVSLVDSGSMPPEWKTFTVKTLDLEAPNAPNNLASVLTEEIKDGIQNNTRLLINPKAGAGEISIEGVVTKYSADPIAIQQGDEAAKNRLSIICAVSRVPIWGVSRLSATFDLSSYQAIQGLK